MSSTNSSLDLERVAELLRQCGVNASFWNSGGDTLGIAIHDGGDLPDDPHFFFGTAGDKWTGEDLADLHDGAGLETDVDSDEDNPTRIAFGILTALTERVRNLS